MKVVHIKEHIGTEEVAVDEGERNGRSLSKDQVKKLTEIGVALEEYFGYALDIEFAVSGEKIAILQARPVTTNSAGTVNGAISPSAATEIEALTDWTSRIAGNWFYGVFLKKVFGFFGFAPRLVTDEKVIGRVTELSVAWLNPFDLPFHAARDDLSETQRWGLGLVSWITAVTLFTEFFILHATTGFTLLAGLVAYSLSHLIYNYLFGTGTPANAPLTEAGANKELTWDELKNIGDRLHGISNQLRQGLINYGTLEVREELSVLQKQFDALRPYEDQFVREYGMIDNYYKTIYKDVADGLRDHAAANEIEYKVMQAAAKNNRSYLDISNFSDNVNFGDASPDLIGHVTNYEALLKIIFGGNGVLTPSAYYGVFFDASGGQTGRIRINKKPGVVSLVFNRKELAQNGIRFQPVGEIEAADPVPLKYLTRKSKRHVLDVLLNISDAWMDIGGSTLDLTKDSRAKIAHALGYGTWYEMTNDIGEPLRLVEAGDRSQNISATMTPAELGAVPGQLRAHRVIRLVSTLLINVLMLGMLAMPGMASAVNSGPGPVIAAAAENAATMPMDRFNAFINPERRKAIVLSAAAWGLEPEMVAAFAFEEWHNSQTREGFLYRILKPFAVAASEEGFYSGTIGLARVQPELLISNIGFWNDALRFGENMKGSLSDDERAAFNDAANVLRDLRPMGEAMVKAQLSDNRRVLVKLLETDAFNIFATARIMRLKAEQITRKEFKKTRTGPKEAGVSSGWSPALRGKVADAYTGAVKSRRGQDKIKLFKLLKTNRSFINAPQQPRGGRWPLLQSFFFDGTEKMIVKLFGENARRFGWFAGQVIMPTLIESVFFVGGGTKLLAGLFGIPFVLSLPLLGIIVGALVLWHVMHLVKKNLWLGMALKKAFNRDKFIISGVPVALLYLMYAIDFLSPLPGLPSVLIMGALAIPHLIVNFLSHIEEAVFERPNTLEKALTGITRKEILRSEGELTARTKQQQILPRGGKINSEEERKLLARVFGGTILGGSETSRESRNLRDALVENGFTPWRAGQILKMLLEGKIERWTDGARSRFDIMSVAEIKMVYYSIFNNARIWRTPSGTLENFAGFVVAEGGPQREYFGTAGQATEVLFTTDEKEYYGLVSRYVAIARKQTKVDIEKEWSIEGPGVTVSFTNDDGKVVSKVIVYLGWENMGLNMAMYTIFHELAHAAMAHVTVPNDHIDIEDEHYFVEEGIGENFAVFALEYLAQLYGGDNGFAIFAQRARANLIKTQKGIDIYRYGYVFLDSIRRRVGVALFREKIIGLLMKVAAKEKELNEVVRYIDVVSSGAGAVKAKTDQRYPAREEKKGPLRGLRSWFGSVANSIFSVIRINGNAISLSYELSKLSVRANAFWFSNRDLRRFLEENGGRFRAESQILVGDEALAGSQGEHIGVRLIGADERRALRGKLGKVRKVYVPFDGKPNGELLQVWGGKDGAGRVVLYLEPLMHKGASEAAQKELLAFGAFEALKDIYGYEGTQGDRRAAEKWKLGYPGAIVTDPETFNIVTKNESHKRFSDMGTIFVVQDKGKAGLAGWAAGQADLVVSGEIDRTNEETIRAFGNATRQKKAEREAKGYGLVTSAGADFVKQAGPETIVKIMNALGGRLRVTGLMSDNETREIVKSMQGIEVLGSYKVKALPGTASAVKKLLTGTNALGGMEIDFSELEGIEAEDVMGVLSDIRGGCPAEAFMTVILPKSLKEQGKVIYSALGMKVVEEKVIEEGSTETEIRGSEGENVKIIMKDGAKLTAITRIDAETVEIAVTDLEKGAEKLFGHMGISEIGLLQAIANLKGLLEENSSTAYATALKYEEKDIPGAAVWDKIALALDGELKAAVVTGNVNAAVAAKADLSGFFDAVGKILADQDIKDTVVGIKLAKLWREGDGRDKPARQKSAAKLVMFMVGVGERVLRKAYFEEKKDSAVVGEKREKEIGKWLLRAGFAAESIGTAETTDALLDKVGLLIAMGRTGEARQGLDKLRARLNELNAGTLFKYVACAGMQYYATEGARKTVDGDDVLLGTDVQNKLLSAKQTGENEKLDYYVALWWMAKFTNDSAFNSKAEKLYPEDALLNRVEEGNIDAYARFLHFELAQLAGSKDIQERARNVRRILEGRQGSEAITARLIILDILNTRDKLSIINPTVRDAFRSVEAMLGAG
jgi:hypothetical protein